VDRLLGDLRAMAHAVDEARAEGGEGPMWAPDPRVAIMPFLEQQSWLANRRGESGYGVLTGRDDCVGFAETYPVEPGSHVVLASDGYPRLFDTLERSEAHLASLLREDPGCYDGLRGTKGIAPGNVSYDDRTYVSLIA
jgi:glycerophosphoryl diester phosphodiesterase